MTTPGFNPSTFFSPEIVELILQHLTGTELLTTSQVSSSFYDSIANSKPSMQKIKLKLSRSQISDDEKNILIKSKRKYENIEIEKFSHLIDVTREILKVPRRQWKFVSFRGIDFESISDVNDVFSEFKSTIEELRMDQFYIRNVPKGFKYSSLLLFPKLHTMEARCCQAFLFHETFINCQSLECFIIKSGSAISTSAVEAIKNLLETNTNLKILGIHFNVFNLLFHEGVLNHVKFKLTEFHAKDLYRTPIFYDQQKKNLKRFLKGQIMTLESVSIGDWMGIDVVKLIFLFPRLKNLTLEGFHHSDLFISWDNVTLHRNHNITHLFLNDKSNNFDILKKILIATPNVKSLELYAIDKKTLKFIGKSCKKLTSLHAEIYQTICFPSEKSFRKLKHFSVKNIRLDISNNKF
ncbi:CLUMA_CG004079, isoform A [Clunio marinus]|uniref:CLUMA_CG004079, isoform A n=1 Tax=Clunio marinus TaxID=568069 RepID=A0A1J1HS21_9DIPT|nr:CLUMA_CG004079, isoform A [Clunio marinus]